MARRCGSAPSDEQMETVVETLDQLIEAKRAKPHGRELDRQRDAVEATRQLDHGGLVVRGHLEGSAGLSRALDEQGDGLRLGDPVRRHSPIGVRHRERADLDDGLPCDPERLPAGGKDPQ